MIWETVFFKANRRSYALWCEKISPPNQFSSSHLYPFYLDQEPACELASITEKDDAYISSYTNKKVVLLGLLKFYVGLLNIIPTVLFSPIAGYKWKLLAEN